MFSLELKMLVHAQFQWGKVRLGRTKKHETMQESVVALALEWVR